MRTQLDLGDVSVDVEFKDIKNIHLSVYPPTGQVRISAPSRMSLDTVRVYVITRLGWIRQQQHKFAEQERETQREYLERESHYVWGERFLLTVLEEDATPEVELTQSRLVLRVRPGAGEDKKRDIVEGWYREELKKAAAPLIEKWERALDVHATKLYVQHMKTKWGGCNPAKGHIRLNTELAKKPPECLEYIVVHELLHLIEPTHNERFIALMDDHLPQWRHHRHLLNSLPIAHEQWDY
ncbi:MAG: SprT family zinc-dependent metalloprotease [Pseudomonadota bacterium]